MNMKFNLLKINPIVKSILFMLLTTLNAVATCLCSKLFLLIFSILLIFFTSSKFKFKIKNIVIFTFISCISNIFCSQGNLIFQFGLIRITDNSIANFFMMLFSMLTFFFTSIVMINSISPEDLPGISEFFLKPLKKFNVNVSEISMIITLALRFVPVVLKESKKIILAQESRGAKILEGSIIKRAKYIIPTFIPIFTSCFRRAMNLATAMECRCYGAPFERTSLYENKVQKIDIIAIILFLVVLVGVLACNQIKIFCLF